MKRTHKGSEKVPHDSGGSDDDNAMEKTFNRGPWTKAEDDVLIAYIEQHGDGNWNAVQKNSTLSRCGKSCRLRWMNHLRPNLKKGAFTDEEEQRVAELHAEIGNKWSRMAAELPGRTDNEIKNFWNTRLKRLKRQGLPVYSEEVQEKAKNAAAHSGLNTNPSMNAHSSQDSLVDELPILDFKFLPTDPSHFCNQSMFPTNGSFLRQRQPCSFQPNMYNSIASSSGTAFPFTSGGSMNEQSLLLDLKLNIEDVLRDIHLSDNATSPSVTAFPFTSGGSMNVQSLLLNVEQTKEDVIHDNATSPSDPLFHRTENFEELPSFQCFDSHQEPGTCEAMQYKLMSELHRLNNATYYSPSELPSFQDLVSHQEPGTLGTQQCDPIPELESLSSSLEHVPDIHCLNNATYYSPSELPPFQYLDIHEEPGTSGTQQCDLIPELESDNTFGSALSKFPPSLYDGLLEPIVYGSSGEIRAAETDSESPPDMSSFLGHTELPPSTSNTTGQNFNSETDQGSSGGSISAEDINFEDFLARIFNKDTNYTM